MSNIQSKQNRLTRVLLATAIVASIASFANAAKVVPINAAADVSALADLPHLQERMTIDSAQNEIALSALLSNDQAVIKAKFSGLDYSAPISIAQ